ncbi:MAG TPA: alkaline phosphatase family protein [Solirubrobacteraceae bacterium]|nr:alkaline phosphatase family protein [Solirubrobacteraceae bacterium]
MTWSNPFVYFASLAKTACAQDDVALTRLAGDLKSVKTTPAFSYIVASPCHDGNPQPCVAGAQPGLKATDRFLRGVVPEILASPAYEADGLIAITFDEAPQSGPYADSSSCCANPTQYPNLTPTTTTPTTTTPTVTTPASEQTGQTTPTGGGGQVGMLLISQYVKPNSTDALDYFNHCSFLSSVEQLFGLKRLGYARDAALPGFGKPQYNNYKG